MTHLLFTSLATHLPNLAQHAAQSGSLTFKIVVLTRLSEGFLSLVASWFGDGLRSERRKSACFGEKKSFNSNMADRAVFDMGRGTESDEA